MQQLKRVNDDVSTSINIVYTLVFVNMKLKEQLIFGSSETVWILIFKHLSLLKKDCEFQFLRNKLDESVCVRVFLQTNSKYILLNPKVMFVSKES